MGSININKLIGKTNKFNIYANVKLIEKNIKRCKINYFKNVNKTKNIPGIYFIYSNNHNLLKIGQTKKLRTRLMQNYSLKYFGSKGIKDQIDDNILTGYNDLYNKYTKKKDCRSSKEYNKTNGAMCEGCEECSTLATKADTLFAENFYFKCIELDSNISTNELIFIEAAATLHFKPFYGNN